MCGQGHVSRHRAILCDLSTLRRMIAWPLMVLGTAAVALITTSLAEAQTVTGRFRYADLNPVTGAVVLRPIAFAKIEIWRFAPRFFFWDWHVAATTATDE